MVARRFLVTSLSDPPTDGEYAVYDSASDTFVGAAGASGAPTDADYLVGTTNAGLSAEIVVGATPQGELGGTWASPTVDATHSGSTHAAIQAAAEATAAADVDADISTHAAISTAHHTKYTDADAIAAIASTFYPIGSIYESTLSTNPGTLLGFGTWVAFGAGRVSVGIDAGGDTDWDTGGETGGAKTVQAGSHTHTGPSHTHTETAHDHSYNTVISHSHTASAGAHNHVQTHFSGAGATTRTDRLGSKTGNNSAANSTANTAQPTITVASTGSASGTTGTTAAVGNASGTDATGATAPSATSVVQPYIVTYKWERTA
jgi:hypothetical protein